MDSRLLEAVTLVLRSFRVSLVCFFGGMSGGNGATRLLGWRSHMDPLVDDGSPDGSQHRDKLVPRHGSGGRDQYRSNRRRRPSLLERIEVEHIIGGMMLGGLLLYSMIWGMTDVVASMLIGMFGVIVGSTAKVGSRNGRDQE